MNPKIIKFRVFGSQTCKDCAKLKKALEIYAVEYEFIDTDDSKNDRLCDEQKIDAIPHLQAIVDAKVIIEKIGYVSPLAFLRDVSAKLAQINSPVDMNLKGVRPTSVFSVEPTRKIENNCNGCKNGSKNP